MSKRNTIHARGNALLVSATMRSKIKKVEQASGHSFLSRDIHVTATNAKTGETKQVKVPSSVVEGKARQFVKWVRENMGMKGFHLANWEFYLEIRDFSPDYKKRDD